MKKFIVNILILLAIASAGVLVDWCATHGEESEALEAQETTLKAFYSALTEGSWDEASAVCDSTAMVGYIENFRKAWNRAQRADTSVLNLAKTILSEGKLTILEQNLSSDDEGRAVFRIDVGENLSKTRSAELRRMEGRWIITGITAVQ